MRESPILIGAPMVRAILDGRKTVTRRIVKPQPKLMTSNWYCDAGGSGKWMADGPSPPTGGTRQTYPWSHCPYGQPSDRLWVREAWRSKCGEDHPECVIYDATSEDKLQHSLNGGHYRLRPSIHMPRWASRITLEVTGVRVEHLQAIDRADALAEGIADLSTHEHIDFGIPGVAVAQHPVRAFQLLWESINGPGSWDANPWVWVVEFRRIEQEARAA